MGIVQMAYKSGISNYQVFEVRQKNLFYSTNVKISGYPMHNSGISAFADFSFE
jgi:hypothetical protein